MKVAVLGLGYVGTVTAAALASRGHDVCGADIDASKVEMIASGRSPVIEPGLDELVAAAVSSGSLRPRRRRRGGARCGRLSRVRRDAVGTGRWHRPALCDASGRRHRGSVTGHADAQGLPQRRRS